MFCDGLMTYPGCIASRSEPVGIHSSSSVMLIRKWPPKGNGWMNEWMDYDGFIQDCDIK